MAKKLGISRQLANRYYLRLMRLGYIERVKRRGRGYITRVIFERTF
jgi:Fic family protein